MSIYNWIAENILAWTLDISRGTRAMACLRELGKSQWWPREKVMELQNERLRKLIRHAYDNVPYYRHLFEERGLTPDDIASVSDLRKLPILNKRIVRRNFEQLKARDFWKWHPRLTATSGSTGEPFVFYGTKDDQQNHGYSRALRARSWCGYKLGDRIVLFRGTTPHKADREKASIKIRRTFRRTVAIDPVTISDETMPLIVTHLVSFSPEFAAGYPSTIYLLARYIQTRGAPGLKLKAVMTSSEQLYDYQRELFQRVFGCDVYSYYSSYEVHDIAAECTEHTGYHIAAEDIVLEIADDAGNPLPEGAEGRILLTNLHNFAMPFIRYYIGDSGVLSHAPCACGRAGLPLLVKLEGRADAILITRSGKRIPGRSLHHQKHLAHLGVVQYQIVQESYDEIVIKLVLDDEYPSERKEQVEQQIKRLYVPIFGEDVHLQVRFVSQIPPAKSGKREVIISKILPDAQEIEW